MILYSKADVLRTLEFYDVNRVLAMSASSFLSRWKKFPPSALWGIRSLDKRGGGGVFHHALCTVDVAAYLGSHPDLAPHLFVCESMAVNDSEHLVCNGEVMIYRDEFGTWGYKGFVNSRKGVNLREAAAMVTAGELPSGMRVIRSRHQVPRAVFDELWNKGILDSCVEFSLYDRPVGIQERGLLFWEIRRY